MLEINKEITNKSNSEEIAADKLLRCGDKAIVKLEFGTKP